MNEFPHVLVGHIKKLWASRPNLEFEQRFPEYQVAASILLLRQYGKEDQSLLSFLLCVRMKEMMGEKVRECKRESG